MALGYIAAFSETLALGVIAEKGLPPLVVALAEEPEDHLKAATAWTLGQVCATAAGLFWPTCVLVPVRWAAWLTCSLLYLVDTLDTQFVCSFSAAGSGPH
jgi:hypothetical protein